MPRIAASSKDALCLRGLRAPIIEHIQLWNPLGRLSLEQTNAGLQP